VLAFVALPRKRQESCDHVGILADACSLREGRCQGTDRKLKINGVLSSLMLPLRLINEIDIASSTDQHATLIERRKSRPHLQRLFSHATRK